MHGSFDMSCDDEAADNIKMIKSRIEGFNFNHSKFGDQDSYKKITTIGGSDVGGKMICRNRIFDCDISFFNCLFYQAPNFFNTKFNKSVSFEFARFFQSCYKSEYYNLFRSLRFEMSRKNLYREESNFWRYEERCVKNSVKTKWFKFLIYNIKKLFSKKIKKEEGDLFSTNQGFIERSLSTIFEITCKRGTSFNSIISSIILLPIVIFPMLYFFKSIIATCIESCKTVDLSFLLDIFAKSLKKSLLYSFDPFYSNTQNDYKEFISFELFASYTQSIIQLSLYIIFVFMLKRRFRISN